MLPSISALTHACSDVAQPALMLNTKDGKKYLLGRISSGFQRTLGEQKIRSSRLQGIWISGRLEWENVSGLPGYLLTLADPQILNRMYSAIPENIAKLSSTWTYINWHDRLAVDQPNSTTFSDENVTIQPVLVGDSSCYIVQSQPVRGRFLAAKALELGVPKGKLFGKLSNGEAVLSSTGKMVSPEDVLEPGPTPSRALVLDLPTAKHVEAALEVNWTQTLYTKRKREEESQNFSLDVAYLFLDSVDPSSPLVQALLARLNCMHYISHPDYSSDEPCQKSLNTLQNELRKALPYNFSVMRSSPPRVSHSPQTNVKILHQGDIFSLAQHDPHHESYIDTPQEAMPLESIDEPQVITLGTGASCPSKYRNVSSTVVRIPTANGVRALMLDCGEGTVGNLKRLHSHADFERVLQELDVLYISHMHADHHLGSLEVIKAWQQANPGRRLTVMGPEALAAYLREWSQIATTPIEYEALNFVDLEVFVRGVGYGPRSEPEERARVVEAALAEANLEDVRTVKAKHCNRSYSGSLSYKLKTGAPFSVAYSGDTLPSSYFGRVCRGATLLVHEATHDDDLAAEAKAKNHSTVGQAVGVARDMQAEHLVLTHFSQRYPKLHKTSSVELGRPTIFAFDGMRFKLSEMPSVQSAMPRIADIFRELEARTEESSEN